MSLFQKGSDFFHKHFGLSALLKALLVILILYFLSLTSHVWMKWLSVLEVILLPFVVGFTFAYILHPLILRLERLGISKKLAVPIVCLLALALVSWLIITLMPMLYDKAVQFINSLSSSIRWLFSWYTEISGNDPSPLIDGISKQAISFLNDYKSWLPNISVMLPQIVVGFIKLLINAVFSLIIAVYMLFDYDKIKHSFYSCAKALQPEMPIYLKAVDEEISGYLRALVILMMIKFVEYSALYLMVGHKDWLIMAALTSLGLLIPYFGATIANCVGLFTALALPSPMLLMLLIGICVLSFVDDYLIAPFVHNKNSKVPPLWTLFSVFAGGLIFGPIGIMIAVPAYMSIRVVINLYIFKTSNYGEK